jgi:hypothetical protein
MSRFVMKVFLPILLFAWNAPYSYTQQMLTTVDVPGAQETDCTAINRGGIIVGYYVVGNHNTMVAMTNPVGDRPKK